MCNADAKTPLARNSPKEKQAVPPAAFFVRKNAYDSEKCGQRGSDDSTRPHSSLFRIDSIQKPWHYALS